MTVRTMDYEQHAFDPPAEPVQAANAPRRRRTLGRLWHDNAAVTSVEYAVMLALILGVILISIKLLGSNTKALWSSNNGSLQSAGLGS
ncbi:MAG TPA: hypothetical protein VMF30_19920 [Pirellulales bacterium]|nr:hypothetical protein [Pirellulales bacterium]